MNEKLAIIIMSAVIAIIFALIFQGIEDAFFTLKYDDDNDDEDITDYEFTDEELYPGCFVYDTITGEIVKYAGIHLGEEDNDIYATCVTVKGNTVHYYYCLFETILHIRQK